MAESIPSTAATQPAISVSPELASPPVCDYASPKTDKPVRSYAGQSVLGILLAIASGMTICMCGHMDGFSMVFTLPALVLSCWGWDRAKKLNAMARVIAVLVLMVAIYVFTKNLIDLLWIGHNPVFDHVFRWSDVFSGL